MAKIAPRLSLFALAFGLNTIALALPVSASDSVFTPITVPGEKTNPCKRLTKTPASWLGDHETDSYRCPGPKGWHAYIEFHGASITATFAADGAPKPDRHLSADAGFGPRIEWRGVKSGSAFAPHAAVLRMRLNGAANEVGTVLTVTRIGGDGICLVAVVDAVAHRDANERARRAADEDARIFKCGTDKPKALGTETPLARYALDRNPVPVR